MEGEEIIDTVSEVDTSITIGKDDEGDDLLQRALDRQGELFRLITTNKDIKKPTADKIKIEVQGLLKIIIEQSNEIHFLRGRVEERERPQTYAEKVAKNAQKEQSRGYVNNKIVDKVKPKSNNVVVIRPKKEQTNEVTLSEIKKSVNPKTAGIEIQGVRNTRGGGIVVRTATEGDTDKLINELNKTAKLDETYEIIKPKKRKPHIMVYDVDSELNALELKEALIENNEIIKEREEINVKHKIPSKYGNSWIIELDPTVYYNLTNNNNNRLKIGWQQVVCKEYLRPTICYNCGKFGHIGKVCKNKTCCMRCGAEGHIKQDCKAKNEHCINCIAFNNKYRAKIDTKHSCLNKTCKSWKNEITTLKARTQYGC